MGEHWGESPYFWLIPTLGKDSHFGGGLAREMLVLDFVGWYIFPPHPTPSLLYSFPEDLTCPGWKQRQSTRRSTCPVFSVTFLRPYRAMCPECTIPQPTPTLCWVVIVGPTEFCPLPIPAMLTNSNVNAFNPSTSFQFGMN